MRLFCLAAALALGSAGAGQAQTGLFAAETPGGLCRAAVAAAERTGGIPAHLLAAINLVESGRRDPATGAVQPWPWTANAAGQGFYYATKAEAVAAVRAMQARGVRSIDVGCGQVNLLHHPDAFASLEQAFDPGTNATYAAAFLRRLFAQSGDWSRAAALYHSATPALGEEYRRRVMAALPEEQKNAAPSAATPLAQAWRATLTTALPGFTRIERSRPVTSGATGLAYQPPPHRSGG